ncbi:MAG: hypothetical protein IJI97_05950 [Clostridia bacterium]|nr:hypothetical protein [Clostridia bacterium]
MDEPVTLSADDVEAVRHLLHYLWESEEADYGEQDKEGQENHIFVSLVQLRSAIGGDPLLLGELE